MSEIGEIREGFIEKFDAFREELTNGERLFLLQKTKFQDSEYKILAELTSGHYFRFSEYFKAFWLRYAVLDAESFVPTARIVTHIAYDKLIYTNPPDTRIIIEPKGFKQYFQFFMVESNPLETFIEP